MKETGLKVGCFVGFSHPSENNCQIVKSINGKVWQPIYKRIIKIGSIVGFCLVKTMSAICMHHCSINCK